jgi:hypothetical protein
MWSLVDPTTHGVAFKDGNGADSDRVRCVGTQNRNPNLKPESAPNLIRVKIHPKIETRGSPETLTETQEYYNKPAAIQIQIQNKIN